jgi:hypothetical protein
MLKLFSGLLGFVLFPLIRILQDEATSMRAGQAVLAADTGPA